MNDVTRVLAAVRAGEPHAAAELLPLVYDELRKLAAQNMAQEKPGQTLQPTALLHEAYLRLVGDGDEQSWDSRGHFFAAAAEAMRRILIERARHKATLKRGGAGRRLDPDRLEPACDDRAHELLILDEALGDLERHDAQAALLVKLRDYGGLGRRGPPPPGGSLSEGVRRRAGSLRPQEVTPGDGVVATPVADAPGSPS
jgi:RNA polymerase sigma factor (TIGR02999 family)